MGTSGFALFDTAIGRCGIAWNERALVAVQLPESDDDRTRARLRRRVPDGAEGPPPRDVATTVERIVAVLDGTPTDLSDIELDLAGIPDFHRRVYEAARTIPMGSKRTYGEIATQLGDLGAARAVGQALGANPFPIVVPCHRVVATGSRTGGFSAWGGVTTKLRILAIEGAAPATLW